MERNEYLLETPLGNALASFEGEALSSLRFANKGEEVQKMKGPPILSELHRQLKAYFNGDSRTFDFSLSPSGTDFQKEVWSLLHSIPFGSTKSYHELSICYGNEKAIRAIAAANGANPIMIIIPCHRVIGADGSLTGYAGGLWRKEALLDLEQGVERLF